MAGGIHRISIWTWAFNKTLVLKDKHAWDGGEVQFRSFKELAPYIHKSVHAAVLDVLTPGVTQRSMTIRKTELRKQKPRPPASGSAELLSYLNANVGVGCSVGLTWCTYRVNRCRL